MARRNDIDWEAIERDVRAGQLTWDQIADKHKVSSSQIRARAKKEGWERDLSEAIKARTKAKIAQIDVAQLVEESATQSATQSAATLKSAIEQAADAATGIILQHRRSYARLKDLAGGMLDEMQEFGEDKPSLQQLAVMIGADDPLAAQALRRVTGFAGRVQSLEKLANTLVKIADAERKAFNLDDETKTGGGIEDFLANLPPRQ